MAHLDEFNYYKENLSTLHILSIYYKMVHEYTYFPDLAYSIKASRVFNPEIFFSLIGSKITISLWANFNVGVCLEVKITIYTFVFAEL